MKSIVVLALLARQVGATTIQVPPPAGPAHDLDNIQAAIDKASNGDTVLLAPGVYTLSGVVGQVDGSGNYSLSCGMITDFAIRTPGGSFSFCNSVLSFFQTDPTGIVWGRWLDSRGKEIHLEGALDQGGGLATTITQTPDVVAGQPVTNMFLVESATIWVKNLRFQKTITGFVAFAPINLENVEFVDTVYPVSAYVDARFSHPHWDPVTAPNDFSGTIATTWDHVRYIGGCGQSHASISALTVSNGSFHTTAAAYAPAALGPNYWPAGFFGGNILTGAFGNLFASGQSSGVGIPNVPIPESVLALSVSQGLTVVNNRFDSEGTGFNLGLFSSLPIPGEQIPSQVGNATIQGNAFTAPVNGTGVLMLDFSALPINGVVVENNSFDTVVEPLVFVSFTAPSTGIVAAGNAFINWAPAGGNYNGAYNGIIYAFNSEGLLIAPNDYSKSGVQTQASVGNNPAAAAIWLDAGSNDGKIVQPPPPDFPPGQSANIADYLFDAASTGNRIVGR